MIRIDPVDVIPECDWTEFTEKEMAVTHGAERKQLITRSTPIVQVSRDDIPIAIVGLYRETLLSEPFLWILLTKKFREAKTSDYLHMQRMLRTQGKMWTLVNIGNDKAERLVRAFGFKPDEGVVLVGDNFYRIMRRPG